MSKKLLIILFVALCFIFSTSVSFGIDDDTKKEEKATEASSKAEKSKAEAKDENIKEDAQPNDPSKEIQKKRGGCGVQYRNHTPWTIKVYANGYYRGTVYGYSTLSVYTSCKTRLVLYGRADFTDGTYLKWGPYVYYTRHAWFTWNLWR
jgi:hypothetical protein